jgi:putative nucleotidyltransferase with HDIG domain
LDGVVDNVCTAIGMDPDKPRIAARFHDIGKMWAPALFTENQGDDNIHDDLNPWVSYHLISRHVSDSVTILVANDFPLDVIKIVSQHHGTTVMTSLFEKAIKIDKKTESDYYRYHTPRPDSLESLILMLCDQVEATSRSLYQKENDIDAETLVVNIYNKLHTDGQFDDVQVLLGDLNKIQKALITDVASNFQKRVSYEEDDELVKKDSKGDK